MLRQRMYTMLYLGPFQACKLFLSKIVMLFSSIEVKQSKVEENKILFLLYFGWVSSLVVYLSVYFAVETG